MRRIQPNTYGSAKQLTQCLQSFAVFELLQNSKTIYIHTPHLSDSPIINNMAGEFSLALPDTDIHQLTLTRLLIVLADRGSSIHICFRDNISNLILDNLKHPSIAMSQRDSIYPPGWITERYALSGVIYFRSNRIDFYEDEIEVSTEAEEVEKLFMNVKSVW